MPKRIRKRSSKVGGGNGEKADLADVTIDEVAVSPANHNNVQRYKDSKRRLSHQSGQHNTISSKGGRIGESGLFVGPEDLENLQDDQANVQDLDEPSLGERLRGIRINAAHQRTKESSSGKAVGVDDDEDEEDEEEDEQIIDDDDEGSGVPIKRAPLPQGSLSLGETLSQALHSNDSAMLSSCLAHSDPIVIRLSVIRLSGPLAVRLLEHCIDLMARGGKKSVGQLSSARARGIIEWVRATLTAHTAYLMSLPSLVQRLAQLHSTLTARLASQEKLLALNGRLELVLNQIELRNAYAQQKNGSARLRKRGGATGGKKGDANSKKAVRQWVEESSEDDDEDEDDEGMDMDDEEETAPIQAEEEGMIQDIALGRASSLRKSSKVKRVEAHSESEAESEDGQEDESDEEDLDEDDDDDEEDEDDDADGLLDIEAEEGSDDESEESEEEDSEED